ncbi:MULTISPECIES: hypothetical protein [unclassified Streptomyces]|uniref:hypothetical protein n=1 Tax=unclassified Streptomyces TaxID=2593676 RepID=UPI002DD91E07|nr:hypothetical protein [Streptomyces sp. NBC_01795]WSA93721.1 hypothetical protein OIE63_20620 [Streptomyces sp. NBC_01795]WSS42450.1 hypothetical protein OG220_19135 [Streptomyces sp. NBC_01187]
MTAGADLRLLRAAVFAAVCVTVSAAGHIFAAGVGVPFFSLALGFACVFAVALVLGRRERSLPGIAGLLALGQIGLHLLFSAGPHSASAGGMTAGSGGAGGAGGSGGGVKALAGKLLCNDSAMGMSEAQAHRVVARAGLSPDAAQAASGGHAVHGSAVHGSAAHGGSGHAAHDAAASSLPFPETPFDCLRDAARAALGTLDVRMLLAHLFAALLLGWLLRRGEAALWRLVRLSADVAAVTDEVVAARALRLAFAFVRALHAGLLPWAPVRVGFRTPREELAPRSVALQHSVHRRGPPATRNDAFALAV